MLKKTCLKRRMFLQYDEYRYTQLIHTAKGIEMKVITNNVFKQKGKNTTITKHWAGKQNRDVSRRGLMRYLYTTKTTTRIDWNQALNCNVMIRNRSKPRQFCNILKCANYYVWQFLILMGEGFKQCCRQQTFLRIFKFVKTTDV